MGRRGSRGPSRFSSHLTWPLVPTYPCRAEMWGGVGGGGREIVCMKFGLRYQNRFVFTLRCFCVYVCVCVCVCLCVCGCVIQIAANVWERKLLYEGFQKYLPLIKHFASFTDMYDEI